MATLSKEEEVELARALLSGNAEGFEQFVTHFRTKVFQYTWVMCGQREDAEEVAQETLLKVFEKLPQLEDPEHVRPWVFRIARNECLMMRRKSIFAPTHELSLDEILPREQVADWSALPDDRLLQSELKAVIGSGIRSLPEIYRSVVLLRDVEELSTEETARILDVSMDVVKTRLHRGRLALRQKLDGYVKEHHGTRFNQV